MRSPGRGIDGRVLAPNPSIELGRIGGLPTRRRFAMHRTPSAPCPRRTLAAVLAAAAALAAPLAALGGTSQNITATATISGGALALSSSATPSVALTLDGVDHTPTYTLPI